MAHLGPLAAHMPHACTAHMGRTCAPMTHGCIAPKIQTCTAHRAHTCSAHRGHVCITSLPHICSAHRSHACSTRTIITTQQTNVESSSRIVAACHSKEGRSEETGTTNSQPASTSLDSSSLADQNPQPASTSLDSSALADQNSRPASTSLGDSSLADQIEKLAGSLSSGSAPPQGPPSSICSTRSSAVQDGPNLSGSTQSNTGGVGPNFTAMMDAWVAGAKWDLPLSDAAVFICWVQISCLQLPLAYGGASIFAELQGRSVAELSTDEIVSAALASDCIQLVGVLYLITSALRPYVKDPTPMEAAPKLSPPNTTEDAWKLLEFRLEPTLVPQSLAAAATALTLIAAWAALSSALGWDVSEADSSKLLSSLMVEAPTEGPLHTSTSGLLVEVGDLSGTSAEPLVDAGAVSGWRVPQLVASNAVLAPITEELLFRGFLLPAFTRWLGPAAAVGASAALFSAFHFSLHDFVPLFILGAVFGSSMMASRGNLMVPILAHATYNTVTLVLLNIDSA